MVQKMKFLLSFIFLILPVILFAQEDAGTFNYSGRKIPAKAGVFTVIGVKSEVDDGDFLLISVYFNDMVDSGSVQNRRIFVNEKAIPPVTRFLFSKNRRMVQFKIKRPESSPTSGGKEFSLRLVQFLSCSGQTMNPIELKGLEENCFFKFSREKREWQKSSL